MKSMKYGSTFLLFCAVLLAGLTATAQPPANSTAREIIHPTPLDTYVFAPDTNYSYRFVKKQPIPGAMVHFLDVTSQAWRTEAEVDRPIWKHWVTVIIPEKATSHTAMLYINGGRNSSEPPAVPDPIVVQFARRTNAVTISVEQIPNQPLKFADQGGGKSEDSLIAYTWDKFVRTGDPTWPLRLPMTKGVVRAMDAVQAFCASPEGGNLRIDDFVVSGGSKRGWTTWTTAAVDKRVKAIMPASIDLLNLIPSFRHHRAVYGGWADAIDDYEKIGIMDWIDAPEFVALMKIVDPYEYRERLTMPKLIVHGAQDEFFLPDSCQFYINDLKGPTWLRCVPNAGHPLFPSDAPLTMIAFCNAILTGAKIPTYSWSFPDENTIRVETPDKPQAVKLWHATNPKARDFRMYILGPAYKEVVLTPESDGAYIGHVETPEKGWTAFLVELTFDAGEGMQHKFTSPVRIVPDTLPHECPPAANPPKGFLSGGAK